MNLFTHIRIVHRKDNLFGESAKHLQQPNPLDIHRARYTLFLFLEQLIRERLTLDDLKSRIQGWPQFAEVWGHPVDGTFYRALYIDTDPASNLMSIRLRTTGFICAIVMKAADTKPADNSAELAL